MTGVKNEDYLEAPCCKPRCIAWDAIDGRKPPVSSGCLREGHSRHGDSTFQHAGASPKPTMDQPLHFNGAPSYNGARWRWHSSKQPPDPRLMMPTSSWVQEVVARPYDATSPRFYNAGILRSVTPPRNAPVHSQTYDQIENVSCGRSAGSTRASFRLQRARPEGAHRC